MMDYIYPGVSGAKPGTETRQGAETIFFNSGFCGLVEATVQILSALESGEIPGFAQF